MRGPIPPSPLGPWHFAQTPSHSSWPSSPDPASCSARRSLEPRVELVARHDLDRREHPCVLEAAELGALPRVRPLVRRLEPRLVGDARDCVDLAAERGDPPRVDDIRVRGGHLEAHGHAGRRAHLVDRDDAVRILVLPVELPAGHLDLELLLTRRGFRDVLDSRQLDEHERRDEEEHDDRAGRPRELELRRAVGLRAVLEAWAILPPVLDDERDQEPFDENEDREHEDRDEEPAVANPLGVRRLGRHRRELGQEGEKRHRLPFYERAGGLVSGNARTAACRRRPPLRGVRQRRRPARGRRLSRSTDARSSSSAS